jgi:hypothetical protein
MRFIVVALIVLSATVAACGGGTRPQATGVAVQPTVSAAASAVSSVHPAAGRVVDLSDEPRKVCSPLFDAARFIVQSDDAGVTFMAWTEDPVESVEDVFAWQLDKLANYDHIAVSADGFRVDWFMPCGGHHLFGTLHVRRTATVYVTVGIWPYQDEERVYEVEAWADFRKFDDRLVVNRPGGCSDRAWMTNKGQYTFGVSTFAEGFEIISDPSWACPSAGSLRMPEFVAAKPVTGPRYW